MHQRYSTHINKTYERNHTLVDEKNDVLSDEVISELDEIGTKNPEELSKLKPIENSSKKGLAGLHGNITPTYVGHVALCPEFQSLVYQVQKERPHLLDNVDGKGVAISKKIINSLKNEYDADYVFVGMRETGDIFVIPTESFNNEWHTKKYDEQYYARLDKDVEEHIRSEMDAVFCEHPSSSNRSITKNKAFEILGKTTD